MLAGEDGDFDEDGPTGSISKKPAPKGKAAWPVAKAPQPHAHTPGDDGDFDEDD